MNKLFLYICSSCIGFSPILSAQDWSFAGVRVYTDTGTINKHGTRYGYSWIRAGKDNYENGKKFRAAAKEAYGKVSTEIKSTKSYNFVAVYKVSVLEKDKNSSQKKRISYYKFYFGKTVDAINKKVAADTKSYKYLSTKQAELIDLQKKKAELNKQPNNPVMGKSP